MISLTNVTAEDLGNRLFGQVLLESSSLNAIQNWRFESQPPILTSNNKLVGCARWKVDHYDPYSLTFYAANLQKDEESAKKEPKCYP